MHREAPRGYTLIEIVVVLAVVSILLGVTVLQLGPAVDHAKVRGLANLLATDLQHAQMLAVRHRRPVIVEVDGSTMTYEITTRTRDTVFVTRDFGSGTQYPVDEFVASPTSLQFFPAGILVTSASYVVGYQGYRRRVDVSRAGQIRINNVP